jgi:hypothetical protein
VDRTESFPRRWTAAELAAKTHSTKKWVLTTLAPMLEAAGALKQVGKAWIGTEAAICAAMTAGGRNAG